MMKFNEKYNPEDFLDFLNDFLPEDFLRKEEDIVIQEQRYKEITKAKILGFSESLDLYVLEMDHTRENDPRIAIATDAFKILADHWMHRALVIFKNKESGNYRLSYLTISLDLNDKNKAVKKYSNARRYSFYLGVDAKIRTPEQQLIKKGRIKDTDDLLSRFSVEVVNKQFYLEIAKFFDELVSNEGQNLVLPGISQDDTGTRKSFAVRLIGRTMFCWFLKQKKSASGQLVPEELLSSKIVNDNYYHNILEPLFFGVLNTSIDSRDIRSDLFDKVPYLNGGLFNPQSDDYYELDRGTFASRYINTLKISDFWFKNFFELLETYNFTIDENTVFDQELSVDPEMLGRIFENLLAKKINPETGANEQKETGSFYTPRQIVDYMVDQSLVEYLKTKTGIDEKKLAALVSYDLTDDAEHPLQEWDKQLIISAIESLKILDPACGSGAYPIGALQKIVYLLQTVDPECHLWLEQKLKGVPELYKQKIRNYFSGNPQNYIRKLDVIKDSIFGVDIQPIAVDVSRLRCFLTLVVESEVDDKKPNRGIEPLPNLDFKFVCANSLISAPEQSVTDGSSLFGDVFQEKLAAAVDRYFSSSGENKRSANNEIHKLIDSKVEEKLSHLSGLVSYNGDRKIETILAQMNKKQIEKHSRILLLWSSYKNIFENKPVDFFGIKYFFPSVKDGFDIVIGNPPYVGEKGNKDIFRNIKDSPLGERFHLGKMDLFYFFFHFGIDVLKDDGVLSFITTNYYITATGARKLIEDFKKRVTVLKLVNFNMMKIFESALGQHNMITILQKGSRNIQAKTAVTRRVGYLHNNNEVIQNILNLKDAETEYHSVKQADLYDDNNLRLRNNSGVGLDGILNKMPENSTPLGIISSINKGFHSGCDKVSASNKKKVKSSHFKVGQGIFVVSKKELSEKELEKQIIHNCYKSTDINKYYTHEIADPSLFVIYTNKNTEIDKFPLIKEHLSDFREFLEMKREYKNGRLPWFSQHWPRDENIFTDKEKIILPYRPKENIFSLCDFDFYASEDVLYIRLTDSTFSTRYILGVLNSRIMYHWLFNKGKRKGNTLELYQDPLSKIPIPKINSEKERQLANGIESLVDQILTAKKSDPKADTKDLESQIDTLVYQLYALTPEEIEIVERSTK